MNTDNDKANAIYRIRPYYRTYPYKRCQAIS